MYCLYFYSYIFTCHFLEKEEPGEAPHFSHPLKPQVVEHKKPALLQCTVVGTPTPVVRWFRGDDEIQPSRTTEIDFNPKTGLATMRLLKPQTEDETIYMVQASNRLGKAQCRSNLILEHAVRVSKPSIMRAPIITRALLVTFVRPGQPLTLEADFDGEPTPEVRWYRNGKELQPKDTKIETKNKTTKLHIPKPQGGKYEVRAENPAGEARTTGTVSVTGTLN